MNNNNKNKQETLKFFEGVTCSYERQKLEEAAAHIAYNIFTLIPVQPGPKRNEGKKEIVDFILDIAKKSIDDVL